MEHTLTFAGNEFSARDIFWRVMHNVRNPNAAAQPAWFLVSKAFGCGSGVAYAMCREMKIDPDRSVCRNRGLFEK